MSINQPSSYALKNALCSNSCARVFHNIAHSFLSKANASKDISHAFKNKDIKGLRREIKVTEIEEFAPKYIDELIEQVSSNSFLEKLRRIIDHASRIP